MAASVGDEGNFSKRKLDGQMDIDSSQEAKKQKNEGVPKTKPDGTINIKSTQRSITNHFSRKTNASGSVSKK